MLPDYPSRLQIWEEGDFILANDRVALVIEDVGPSDLYDPWGGRPVGLARVEGGALVEPADFGEFFILMDRMAIVTEFVGVVNDGSDGEAAVIRAQGRPSGLPFLDPLLRRVYLRDYSSMPSAIDYVLEPGAEHVDIYLTHIRSSSSDVLTGALRGFMYGPRMPPFYRGAGFNADASTDLLAFADDDATSWAYAAPEGTLGFFLSQSGFTGMSGPQYLIEAEATTRVHYARIYIGGRGIDGVLAAVARTEGETQRTITGTVVESDGSTPAEGVRVHAEQVVSGGDNVYLTRTLTDASGNYTLHVPADAEVELTTFRRGDTVLGPINVPVATASANFTLTPTGTITVATTALNGGAAIPARIQVLPAGSSVVPSVPGVFGEPRIQGGRLHVDYATGDASGVGIGQASFRAPVGDWEIIVSRGPGVGDLPRAGHRHRRRDGQRERRARARRRHHERDVRGLPRPYAPQQRLGDDVRIKIRSAVADGLEIPARSEHEYAELTDPVVLELGLGAYAYGLSSLELTTFEFYGHFGVIPLTPNEGQNGGTEPWQTYPTAADRDQPLVNLRPPELFANTRARPEQPAIIINHPRGGTNYFDFVGLDPDTGDG